MLSHHRAQTWEGRHYSPTSAVPLAKITLIAGQPVVFCRRSF
jgi:hypothetical protein